MKDSFANQDLLDLIQSEKYMEIFALQVGSVFKDRCLHCHALMESITLFRELSQHQTVLRALQARIVWEQILQHQLVFVRVVIFVR